MMTLGGSRSTDMPAKRKARTNRKLILNARAYREGLDELDPRSY